MIRCWALALLLVMLAAPRPADARPPWQSISWYGDLERAERQRVQRLAAEIRAYGSCTETVATCFERSRRIGWRLARLIIYLVQSGADDNDIRRIIKARRTSAAAPPKTIDVRGAPVQGASGARVTVVEFADLECPFCARLSHILLKVIPALKGKAKLVFKHFPLKSHRTSLPAALAAVAAQAHGKFWEMLHLLFANTSAHGPGDLEGYAKKLGIPLADFRARMKDHASLKRVEQDKDLGLNLGVKATPTLFINGKLFMPSRDLFLVQDRIEEEIDLVAGRK